MGPIKRDIVPDVGELVRRNLRYFLILSAAGLALRLIFLFRFPGVVTDSFVYGDIAKNWLEHGIYGLSGPEEVSPTYIRLPGYPAFLALIFKIFGMEHYRAALVVEIKYAPPLWVHALLWVPLILLVTLAPLRLIKGLLIALQYHHDAAEGRLDRGDCG